MNRTLRWLYRTKLNREEFNKNLSKKRMQQLNHDYRQYLKCRGTKNFDIFRKYLEDKGIPYTEVRPNANEEYFDEETSDYTYDFTDPYGQGLVFDIEGREIKIFNVVYCKSYYSIRTFSFIQIGENIRFNNWIEDDILELLQHLPPILSDWNRDDIIIDREFLKREKIQKLNAIRDNILKLQHI